MDLRSRVKPLTVHLEYNEYATMTDYWPESRPWFVAVTEEALASAPLLGIGVPPGVADDLRRWGYRRWASSLSHPYSYYARPWSVWAFAWTHERLRLGYWAAIAAFYRWGVFHLDDEAALFRWRNVRPGRGS